MRLLKIPFTLIYVFLHVVTHCIRFFWFSIVSWIFLGIIARRRGFFAFIIDRPRILPIPVLILSFILLGLIDRRILLLIVFKSGHFAFITSVFQMLRLFVLVLTRKQRLIIIFFRLFYYLIVKGSFCRKIKFTRLAMPQSILVKRVGDMLLRVNF